MSKRLYIEGHHHKLGYVISVSASNQAPVRYYKGYLRRARAIVDRFNRRFASAS